MEKSDMVEPVTLDFDVYDPPSQGKKDLVPVIFAHGYMDNRKMYANIVKKLSEKLGRKIYSIDLRNHGTSPRAPMSKTEDNTPDLRKFMEDTGLKKVSFICHSFSCVAAHMIALENPEAVEKIVMIDHLPDCSDYKKCGVDLTKKQADAYNRLLKLLYPQCSLEEAKRKILNMGSGGSPTISVFMKKVADDLTKENGRFKFKIDVDYLLRVVENMIFYIQPDIVYEGEILLIRTVDSKLASDENLPRSMKLNPNMKVETYERGGHMLVFEETERFLDDVTRFLNT